MTPEERAVELMREMLGRCQGVELERAIARAIRAAVAEEREACAGLADGAVTDCAGNYWYGGDQRARSIAREIRGRK